MNVAVQMLAAFVGADMNDVVLLIWLAVATASLSYTITMTTMFDWLRDRLPDGMFFNLMVCPYCMAHWIAFGFIGLYRPMPFSGTPFDFLAAAFIIVTVAALIVQLFTILGRVSAFMKRYENKP